MQFGGPHQISKIFQKTQCTKNSFPFFVALGVARGHTCQWLSDVYYYGPGLLRSWWFLKIMEHNTDWIIQLFLVLCFGGVAMGAHLQMFIYCLLSWAWLAQILQLCRKSWNTQFCNVCVLGWLGPNKSLAHALICLFL